MPSEIFKRALFQAANKPTKNDSGIMQGFDEEDEEEKEDEMMDEVNQRSVKSPEILMNNLRGDMRSVDARYQELADMVGEEAAMETPPEVLAMLQPQLMAQQAPTGIGALPAQGMPPPSPSTGAAPMPTTPPPATPAGIGGMMPPGMTPPPMPQEPAPAAQGPAPQGFAYGGMVNSAPGYGPMSMAAPPMYQGAMAPQGFAQGGMVGNPAQGIQQFKGGGMVKTMVDSAAKNNPASRILRGKGGAPVGPAGAIGNMGTALANTMQPTAEMIAAQQAEAERKAAAELAEKRDKIFRTPTITDEKTKLANINPEFLTEFARRFEAGNQRRNYQPFGIQNTAAFGAQGNPAYGNLAFNPMQFMPGGQFRTFANGGVVDIPQASANYTRGASQARMPGDDIPQGGAVYTKGLENAGRNGDNMLVHMSQSQADLLKFMGGAGSKNPKTGLPEYFTEDDVDAVSAPGAGTTGSYSPEVVSQARTYMDQFLNQRPTPVPTLEEGIKARQPIYSRLLGGEDQKEMSQARILFDIAQRGLNFAANVDDQGRPIRGSGVQRFAQSFRSLPTAIGQETKYMDEVERAARLAAFQATEKEIESTRAANIKLIEGQRKAFSDIIKSDGGGAFGKSLTGRIANMFSSDLVTKFAKGETSPQEERQLLTAVNQYTQPIERTNPETGLLEVRRPELPRHVQIALDMRKLDPKQLFDTSKPSALPEAKIGEIPSTAQMASRSVATTPKKEVERQEAGVKLTDLPKEVASAVDKAPQASFLDLADTGTGFVPVLVGGFAKKVPLDVAGKVAPQFQQSTALLTGLTNRLVNALQENPKFAEGERKTIRSEVETLPALFTNTPAFQNQTIAVDIMLESIEQRERNITENLKTEIGRRKEAQAKIETLEQMRNILGVQNKRVNSPEQWSTLPPGNYAVFDPDRKIYVPRTKYK